MNVKNIHLVQNSGTPCKAEDYFKWILLTLSLKFHPEGGDMCSECWNEIKKQFPECVNNL